MHADEQCCRGCIAWLCRLACTAVGEDHEQVALVNVTRYCILSTGSAASAAASSRCRQAKLSVMRCRKLRGSNTLTGSEILVRFTPSRSRCAPRLLTSSQMACTAPCHGRDARREGMQAMCCGCRRRHYAAISVGVSSTRQHPDILSTWRCILMSLISAGALKMYPSASPSG